MAVVGPAVLFFSDVLPPLGLFGLQLVGIAAFAVWLESRRIRGNECPWLDVGASRRIVMYGVLWLVGLLTLLPLGLMGLAPGPVLGVLTILVVIPAVALLRQHVIVDHGDLEETGIPWWLFASARLPVYFLILLGVLVLILAVLSFLPWTRPA
jgi:hypothetical protein